MKKDSRSYFAWFAFFLVLGGLNAPQEGPAFASANCDLALAAQPKAGLEANTSAAEILASQPDFMADMVDGRLGEPTVFRLMKKGERRRFETVPTRGMRTYTGQREVEIYRPGEASVLLVPAWKQYAELPPDEASRVPTTLAELIVRHQKTTGASFEMAGTEVVDGHETLKIKLEWRDRAYDGEHVIEYAYAAKDLHNLIIRFEQVGGGADWVSTLRSIALDVSDTQFEIPFDFKKVTYSEIGSAEREKVDSERRAEEKKYRLHPTTDSTTDGKIYIPRDLDGAHAELERMLTPALLNEMRDGTQEDMARYHLSLGLWMRNNWSLWKESSLARYFHKLGIDHPDDMSGIILDTFWCRLNKKPLGLEERIRYSQEYWRAVAGPDTTRFTGCSVGVEVKGYLNEQTNDGKPRAIHYGYCAAGNELWVYEYDKGWYRPDAELTKRILSSDGAMERIK